MGLSELPGSERFFMKRLVNISLQHHQSVSRYPKPLKFECQYHHYHHGNYYICTLYNAHLTRELVFLYLVEAGAQVAFRRKPGHKAVETQLTRLFPGAINLGVKRTHWTKVAKYRTGKYTSLHSQTGNTDCNCKHNNLVCNLKIMLYFLSFSSHWLKQKYNPGLHYSMLLCLLNGNVSPPVN